MIENNNNKGVSKQLAFAISGVALLIIAVAGSAYAYLLLVLLVMVVYRVLH